MSISLPAQCYVPKRFIVVALGFLGILINFIIRGALSVAIVAMVNNTQHSSINGTIFSSECPVSLDMSNATDHKAYKGERYNWDPLTQGYLMSAYFYCYFVTVLAGGYLADKFGATRMFGGGVFLGALLCLFIPTVAKFGLVPLIIVRSLQGISLGVTSPSMSAVISRWSPKLERSVISTVVFSGATSSSVIANPISGWLATLDFLGGWPAIFYLSGLSGCIWYIFWFIFVYERPSLHPSITEDELLHFPDEKDIVSRKKHVVPWKSIVTSLPVWSHLIAHCAASFTFNIMFLELPTYFSTVLHFNIKASGMLSTLPFLAEFIAAWISSFAADKIRTSGRWSITALRKFFNSVAGYGICVCLLLITFSGCNASLIMGLLTFGMLLDGFKYSGYHAATFDMTTDFAGTLFAIGYCASSLAAMLGPGMVGAFTVSGTTVNNWSKVFYVTAAVNFTTTTLYAVFTSAELQPWGKIGNRDEKNVGLDKNI